MVEKRRAFGKGSGLGKEDNLWSTWATSRLKGNASSPPPQRLGCYGHRHWLPEKDGSYWLPEFPKQLLEPATPRGYPTRSHDLL